MEKCQSDWKTCGHCKVAFDSGMFGTITYGSCDKCGFWASLIGNDLCPNAPLTVEED